ncbi:FtsK/SpoIIIE domain-containing protein, partial [Enterococcus faecalis]
TQLEAVITTIGEIFEQSTLTIPDKPWLPNLEEQIPTPVVERATERSIKIPLGLLDIPAEQSQQVYEYDLEKTSHTGIFASPGYGKSTILQTIAINLARKNTPEQVQFNLIDFGNNGLLPLKGLPHVADIVTLEEAEKLQKMLDKISQLLAQRKKLFKTNGVASLAQYEAKTQSKLPIIINLLDSYDGLSLEDKRKDGIDELLLQLLRDGASLGIYLIFTASRSGSIRMNMMSNIATKMALYLNDDSELNSLLGREVLAAQAINGRGQVLLEAPTAIQFYLPTKGATSAELLENLEAEVTKMNQDWTGTRPKPIPMVPEELTIEKFQQFVPEKEANQFYLGLNKLSALPEMFPLFQGKTLGIFVESNKQFQLLMPFFMQQLEELSADHEVILIDITGNLETMTDKVAIYIERTQVAQQSAELKEALTAMALEKERQRVVVINGLVDLTDKVSFDLEEVSQLLNQSRSNTQLIVLDSLMKLTATYGSFVSIVKENLSQLLFGGTLQNQLFVENIPFNQQNIPVPRNILNRLQDDILDKIVIPTEVKK